MPGSGSTEPGFSRRNLRLADVAQAVPRVPVEAAAYELAHRGRGRRRQRAEVRLAGEDGGEHVAHRLSVEEPPACEHLPEDDAEGPDVGAPVDGLSAGLLGRHVRGRAEDDSGAAPGGRHRGRVHHRGRALEVDGRRGARRVHRLGEAEVEDLDLAVRRELDVCGLEVAVDDPLLVRLLHRLGDLPGDGERLVERERPSLQPLGEVLARHELHHEGAHAVRLLEAVDRGDVGVLQLGQELRLALEAREALRVPGEVLRQDLDRDLALEL